MARIAGVDLPRNKRIEIGLTYIYGIGLSSSQNILTKAQVNSDIRCKDLTDQDISIIREIIDKEYQVEGAARRIESLNIRLVYLYLLASYASSFSSHCASVLTVKSFPRL